MNCSIPSPEEKMVGQVLTKATTKARQAISFALREAAKADAPAIDSEHLLLGLLTADETLINRFFPPDTSIDTIRKKTNAYKTTPREPGLTEHYNHLSTEVCRILSYANEEAAEQLSHVRIETEDLLLGLLRDEQSLVAPIFQELGLRLSEIRERLRGATGPSG